MSSPSVKAENGSKVLPGDKSGLPWEIWRIILSYLSAEDLCGSACVCKTWNDLVMSLDSTRWHELYLQCSDWKHPYWPLNTDSEPLSWRQAYRDQIMSIRFWSRYSKEPDPGTNCLYVLKRRKDRKVIRVGRDMEHSTLKSALAVANDYDRIEVYPGIYDEQFEMSSKIPFELIGVGELGSIILVVCIEQIGLTGRVSNLVFRAPWFTNFILKVRFGYLQVDNCILEDGMVYVQSPGSSHIKYCTFRHATVIFQHLTASIIENCEFSQTDTAAVTIEGYPKDDRNWTYNSLLEKISQNCNIKNFNRQKKDVAPFSAYSASTALTSGHKTLEKSYTFSTDHGDFDHRRKSICSSGKFSSMVTTEDHGNCGHSSNGSVHFESVINSDVLDYLPIPTAVLCDLPSFDMTTPSLLPKFDLSTYLSKSGNDNVKYGQNGQDNELKPTISQSSEQMFSSQKTSTMGDNLCDQSARTVEKSALKLPEDSPSNVNGPSSSNVNGPSSSNENGPSSSNMNGPSSSNENAPSPSDYVNGDAIDSSRNCAHYVMENDARNLPDDDDASSHHSNANSNHSNRSGLSGSSESLYREDSDEFDSGSVDSGNSNHHIGGSSTSSSDIEEVSYSSDDFSSEEESVIMLSHPDHQMPRSISSISLGADVQSICSQNQSEHIKIIEDNDMKKVLDDIRGCMIHRCRITQGKGGVVVALQAHAVISHCDINSVGYGIRCIQNSKVVILKNEIHHCRTSGIFMRLAASGVIAGNDIHSNCEAGIDIRKNADPIVQCNRIHHSKRSGIVVLGSGRGQIKSNEIYQNKEAGVYILYRGNPIVSKNHIHSGKAAGIAINEGGTGYIADNVISENHWGGVDIRHGGDPVIVQNIICNGLSDGVVIGEKGKGSIENNVISGNSGCGVWVTTACQPMIHGNQINNNGSNGITFVNKTDLSHEGETMNVDIGEMTSQRSMQMWQLFNDEQPPPRRMCTRATVEYNSIYHNNGCGIKSNFGDELVIQCNAVHGNRRDGILLNQNSPVLVKDNSVTCNSGNGIITDNQGKIKIQGNGVYDNRDHGIISQCEVIIEDNDVVGNQRSAIQLDRNPSVKVVKNRIHSKSDKAITMTTISEGQIHDNTLFKGLRDPLQCSSDSKCTVKNNENVDMDIKTNVSDDLNASKHGKDFSLLKDPPARPHIEAPPTIIRAPANHITTVTRVTIPSDNQCQDGSKLCIIL
ncbi:F-box only protein 10-like isoform X1 [Mytilus californianus]|uniref:F-box only protein 10-like isoform X1 n=1 Tax=Mytilus californianus TaxID=6549 RepID=UPI0022467BDD|nr:F-box only protein 10-like isoform X1 [Mytilus californianus]